MEYAPLEKRPDQPETNQRTDVARFVGDTYIPAAEPEYGSVWPYMPGMHVNPGIHQSEAVAGLWQTYFYNGPPNAAIMGHNPYYRPPASEEHVQTGSTVAPNAPSAPSTISRAPAVQPSTVEEGFPLNKAQAEKVDNALAGAGQPLPEEQKAVYEAHTGHDFSRVRVHTGTAAEEAADSIGAKAFAKGSDIVFAKDQYNPSTAEGRGLIGHELAHVAQNATGVHRAPKDEKTKDDSWLQSLREKGEAAYSKIVDVNQRLSYIDKARDLSNKYERESLFRRLERDAIDLLIGLLAVLLIAGLTIVLSVLLGALIGSLAGPGGAALGAFIGLKISVALVEFFGLVAIMAFVYGTLKEAGQHYWKFLTLAWNSQGNEKEIEKAAQECAEGNVTIAAAVLEGLVLYGIGRGLSATLAKFKNSRFVRWIGPDRFEAWLKRRLGKQEEVRPDVSIAPPRSFEEVPVMKASEVQSALKSGGYSGNTDWAYSIHEHHVYPKWLGGAESGPRMKVRGYEHIKDLEPALFKHIKAEIPLITEKSTRSVKTLIDRRIIQQSEITQALVNFYARRYPGLSRSYLKSVLEGAL